MTALLPRLRHVAAFLALTLLSSVASSEPAAVVVSPSPSSASEDARLRYQKGVLAYASGRYAEAIELFRDADRREPSAALSFNIARAYGMLGDDANALGAYRDYLRRAEAPEDTESVRRLVAMLAKRIAERGVQQVTILSVPPSATVVLDGAPVGIAPFTAEIPPGRHVVSLHLDGRVDAVRRFDLPVSEPLDVRATLAPEPVVRAEPPPATGPAPRGVAPRAANAHAVTPSASPAPARPLRTAGIVALGAGGLSLGGALVYELLRRDAQHDAENEHVQLRLANDLDRMQSRRTAAQALAGLGAGFAAVGAVLLIVNPSDPPRQDPGAQVKVAVMPSGVTGAVSGRF